MNKYRKRTISISIATLVGFLVLSLLTSNWKFFLWSLLPIFMVLMLTFTAKPDKKSSRE